MFLPCALLNNFLFLLLCFNLVQSLLPGLHLGPRAQNLWASQDFGVTLVKILGQHWLSFWGHTSQDFGVTLVKLLGPH